MSAKQTTEPEVRSRPTSLVGWGLLTGGVIFFVGGSMHPKEDPPGVSMKEHLHAMYVDPLWFPAHALLLLGTALIAAALVLLVRGGTLAGVPRVQTAGTVAAVAAVLGTLETLLHLVAAVDANRIADHTATPLSDVLGIVETIAGPVFGFSIAALAVVGALTRTIGNRVTAVLGVVGGVAYGIATATILVTAKTDFLFPLSAGIGLWTVAAGIGLLLRSRSSRPGSGSGYQPGARVM
ncbi:MAG: hypothetical protein ABI775_05475 [Pseudonocardiales bacterium]